MLEHDGVGARLPESGIARRLYTAHTLDERWKPRYRCTRSIELCKVAIAP
jgi:hypothetical protein